MAEYFHFYKTDPAGNTTAVVTDFVPAEERSALAVEMMKPNALAVEQVAFTEKETGADAAISLMGREFCGNAVRSVAAYHAFKTDTEKEEILIRCSGADRPVRTKTRRVSRAVFDVAAEMPLPESIDEVTMGGYHFLRVQFPGIVHFLIRDVKKEMKDAVIHEVLGHISVPSGGAAGVLFVSDGAMDPFVYVKDTDTLVNENSCGSGTAALAAGLAWRRKEDVRLKVRQRGGVIEGFAKWKDEAVSSLAIGGEVKIVCEGDIFI